MTLVWRGGWASDILLREEKFSGIGRKSIGLSLRINHPAENLGNLDRKVVQMSKIAVLLGC